MLLDTHHRPLRDLRISVTDRCNFRCTYCMPLDHYDWIARSQILSYEEIGRLAGILASLGVRKVRITGGEPLLRKQLPDLVRMLSAIDGLDDLCLTTNGSLLEEMAGPLRKAGLDRVTISIDSLDPDTFARIAQRARLAPVLRGVAAAKRAGLAPIKLNTVIERGVNDHEIADLLEFSLEHGFEIRFIEYMDVGTVNQWNSDKLVSKAEILERIRSRHQFEAEPGRGSAPSQSYLLRRGRGRFGVIASVTEPFCGACTRLRLTADGRLVTCLFSDSGHDLKSMLRSGADDAAIRARIVSIWRSRNDRYSEQRLVAISSAGGYNPEAVRKLEMISLGG